MPTTLLPNSARNSAGATLLPGKVIEAVELLELKCPVHIKWANGTRRAGAHRFRDGVHVITLSTYSGAKQLTRTLWHELTHAVQQETFESREDFIREYNLECRRFGYTGCKFEVEAREFAEAFEDNELAR